MVVKAAEGLLYSFKKDTQPTFEKKICLCVYLHARRMWCPRRSEEEVEYPGTGLQVVVSGYVGAGNQTLTGPRQEQQVLLRAEASLSPDLTL